MIIDLEQIAYCISDSGSNLTCAFRLLKCKHIADINHKFTLILQSVYEKNPLLNEFTKALSLLRAQKSMSKIARIVPPNQRIMNRFMNLTPLFKWGIKMLHLLDTNELNDEEKQVLSFLVPMRDFIDDTYQILIGLHKIQKILKNKGFDDKSAEEAKKVFKVMKSANSLKISTRLNEFFADLKSKAESKTICCSSDIIESCFGKYKEIVKGNKTVGISDLCLCIAALTGMNNQDKTNQAMETVSSLCEFGAFEFAEGVVCCGCLCVECFAGDVAVMEEDVPESVSRLADVAVELFIIKRCRSLIGVSLCFSYTELFLRRIKCFFIPQIHFFSICILSLAPDGQRLGVGGGSLRLGWERNLQN